MIHQLTSIADIETILIKLLVKQKDLIYQIARLDYRIYKSMAMLEVVNRLIAEEEENILSLNTAINALGSGKVKDQLVAWKVKAEFKLFKLNLRKNKIDIIKLIINQSKLEQLKQVLTQLEADIESIESQKPKPVSTIKQSFKSGNSVDMYTFWQKAKFLKEQDSINQSIKDYLKEHFKIAS